MKWVHLVAAPELHTARLWVEMLIKEGIPAALDLEDVISAPDIWGVPCRLIVPQARVDEAMAVLAPHRGEEGT